MDEFASLPGSGASGGVTGIGDIYDAALASSRYISNSNARSRALEEAAGRRIDEVFKATGVRLDNPELAQTAYLDSVGRGAGEVAKYVDPYAAFDSRIAELAQQHPDKLGVLRPHEPILQSAYRLAQQTDQTSTDMGGRYGGPKGGAMLAEAAAGIRTMIEDPVQVLFNAATLPFAAGANLLRGALINGTTNGVGEALKQPFVQTWRQEAGLDYGWTHAAQDVGMAAVVGAAVDTGIRATSRTAKFGAAKARGEAPSFKDMVLNGAPPQEVLKAVAAARPPEDPLHQAIAQKQTAPLRDLANSVADALEPEGRGALQHLNAEHESGLSTPAKGVDPADHARLVEQSRRFFAGLEPPPKPPEPIPEVRGPTLTDEAAPPGKAFQADGKAVSFTDFDPRSISTDAEAFQFKGNGDAAGVTERLNGIQRWDDLASGKVFVFERQIDNRRMHGPVDRESAAIDYAISTSDWQKIRETPGVAEILKRLDRLGVPVVPYKIKNKEALNPMLQNAEGAYMPVAREILVRADANDLRQTLQHEELHALKASGAISKAEWSKLVAGGNLKIILNGQEQTLRKSLEDAYKPVYKKAADGQKMPAKQIKEMIDEEVVARLYQSASPSRVDTTFNDFLSGVVHDRVPQAKIKTEQLIADGHQRLGLAKRLLADGSEADIKLSGYLFREADGWKPGDVKALAAKKNLQEGSGTVLDAARMLRERPDIIDTSVPLAGGYMRTARNLAKLSDDGFDLAWAGHVPENQAAVIGELVHDAGLHAGMIRELGRADLTSERQARLYVSQAVQLPHHVETQLTLFGRETETRTLMAERTQVLDTALKTLSSDAKVFASLSRESGLIEAAGNVLAKDANLSAAARAEQARSILQSLAMVRGPVSDALTDAARGLADGAPKRQVAAEFARKVSDLLEERGLNGLVQHDEGVAIRTGIADPVGVEAKGQTSMLKTLFPEQAAAGKAKFADMVEMVEACKA
jgi:hypothetical protein